ncbi:VIT domain-containing protein [Candidatus Contubernalis alkaliaceticus]|uniref:VIT domain-containing protein n=1 Tax=Candidatus Contubernalis alkaliaceticus TaxID=338645 RepID=UPI001F4BE4F1|nr:VIT domain-containing protein [Candidatus Contubernalis alkalaceticus]UNC91261.1 hypothetical protein HUE98_03655 [Candidatus Contubernalis alkalaceticus]
MQTGLVFANGSSVDIPLKHVKISGNICGFHGEFTVFQTYINDSWDSIEVIYTFPLPDTSVVTGFTASIGDRVIKSEVREKDEAFEIYEKAVRNGDSAFLLEQFRPNIFQISLGQILPGEEVKVSIIILEIEYMVEARTY